jgi:hypothetical protein
MLRGMVLMTDLTEKENPWKGLGNQLLQKTKSVNQRARKIQP